jgi:hypothetical protein
MIRIENVCITVNGVLQMRALRTRNKQEFLKDWISFYGDIPGDSTGNWLIYVNVLLFYRRLSLKVMTWLISKHVHNTHMHTYVYYIIYFLYSYAIYIDCYIDDREKKKERGGEIQKYRSCIGNFNYFLTVCSSKKLTYN